MAPCCGQRRGNTIRLGYDGIEVHIGLGDIEAGVACVCATEGIFMKRGFRKALSTLLAISIALGALMMTSCSSKSDDQDGCYGDDLPAQK